MDRQTFEERSLEHIDAVYRMAMQLARHPDEAADITITELIAAYVRWAKQYCRRDGESTGYVERLKPTLRLLRETYGHTDVADFGPVGLKRSNRK